MDLKRLAAKAKRTIDDRGGVDSLKADAEELKRVAKGKGSLTDKAKRAAQAVKEPGARAAGREQRQAEDPGGEMHPAKDAGDHADTPRKGGPPHS